MKLIICGKGGSGKSTITSLLARQYALAGKQVVVVDTDVSNVGLHRILGTEEPTDLIDYFGDKRSMMESLKEARQKDLPPTTPLLGTWTFDSIPTEYRSIKDNVQLVSIGKINEATEGCKCSQSAVARQFLLGLTLAENDRVIVDTEAGIEHFGRGLDTLCNAILMVVDPSFESQCLVGKVSEMAATIGVPLYFILNKTDAFTSQSLRDSMPDKDRIIGEFVLDPEIIEAGLEGRALPENYPAASAVLENLTALFGASQPACG
jgi:CO dehydrogenase maturation factor